MSLEDQLLDALANADNVQLQSLIEQHPIVDVTNLLDRHGCSADTLRAVLIGCRSLRLKMLSVIRALVPLLESDEVSARRQNEWIATLTTEIPSSDIVVEISAMVVQALQRGDVITGKSMDLLPKCINAVAPHATITIPSSLATSASVFQDDVGLTLPGLAYKNIVIDAVCAASWAPRVSVSIATMFKDVEMNEEQISKVITRICEMLKQMDIQETPPLIYQLLLLTSKGGRRVALEKLIHHFDTLDRMYASDGGSDDDAQSAVIESDLDVIHDGSQRKLAQDALRHVQGTVILHINYCIKQDLNLGKELLKIPLNILTNFRLAILLSVARIPRFEEKVFLFLKSTILHSFKEEEQRHKSTWIEVLKYLPKIINLNILFNEIIHYSSYGWDHITQSLVQLGVLLMDSGTGAKGADVHASVVTPHTRVLMLGMNILYDTFELHEMVRKEIFEQIFSRVVTRADNVGHYITLLGRIVKTKCRIITEYIPQIKDALSYISYLCPTTASGFLNSLWQLLKNKEFLDYTVLILRKAMCSREVDARLIAVSGFLLLFRLCPRGALDSRSSQAADSYLGGCSSNVLDTAITCDPHLFHEIISFLRRCFGQQAPIKSYVYHGLIDVYGRRSHLRESIFELLIPQFLRYIDIHVLTNRLENNSTFINTPFIRLNLCIDSSDSSNAIICEPLPHLLNSLQRCLLINQSQTNTETRGGTLGDDPLNSIVVDDDSLLATGQLYLLMLIKGLIKSEMEEYNLHSGTDFSPSTDEGRVNRLRARLILGILDVCLEYTLASKTFTLSQIQQYSTCLFKIHKKLSHYVDASSSSLKLIKPKEKASGLVRVTDSDTLATSATSTVLNLSCAIHMLKILTHYHSNETVATSSAIADASVGRDRELEGALIRHMCQSIKYHFTPVYQGVFKSSEEKNEMINSCLELAAPLLYCFQNGHKWDVVISANTITDANGDDTNIKKKKKKLTIEKETDNSQISLCELSMECYWMATHLMITCSEGDNINKFMSSIPSSMCDDDVSMENDDADDEHRYRSIHNWITFMKQFLSTVMYSGRWNETNMILKVMSDVMGLLPRSETTTHSTWMQSVCEESYVSNESTAQLLVKILLKLRWYGEIDLTMANDVLCCLGDSDKDNPKPPAPDDIQYRIINPLTAIPIALILIKHVDEAIVEAEWVLMNIKCLTNTLTSDPKQTTSLEEAVYGRCIHVVDVLHVLVQSNANDTFTDAMVQSCIKIFRLMDTLTRRLLLIKNKDISKQFIKLIDIGCGELKLGVDSMISTAQLSGKLHSRAYVSKELRHLPTLVFTIETCERFVIKLAKVKGVALIKNLTRSTGRDFRINSEMIDDTDLATTNVIHNSKKIKQNSKNKDKENKKIMNISLTKSAIRSRKDKVAVEVNSGGEEEEEEMSVISEIDREDELVLLPDDNEDTLLSDC